MSAKSTGPLGLEALPQKDLHDFFGDVEAMKDITRKLRDGGMYVPWSSDKISDSEISSIISKWKGSSSYVRHNIQYKDGKSGKGSQGFDDWLNSGSYGKTLYRGTAMTDKDFAAIKALKKGDYVGQNGPASFSKTVGVAKKFADNGYNVGKNKVVFVLQGGTKAGRDISKVHGYANEREVAVGSASNMRVSKVVSKVVGGETYTYVYGREEKMQYVPHTTH